MTTQQQLYTELNKRFLGVEIPIYEDRKIHIKSDEDHVTVIFSDDEIPNYIITINNRFEYSGKIDNIINYLSGILQNRNDGNQIDSDFE